MEWKFKDIDPLTISEDGFWYDLNAGSFVPANVLADATQLTRVKAALKVLQEFRRALEDEDLLEYEGRP